MRSVARCPLCLHEKEDIFRRNYRLQRLSVRLEGLQHTGGALEAQYGFQAQFTSNLCGKEPVQQANAAS